MSNNAIIFGDSYSTFAGFVPFGYSAYYSENKRPETDVTNVSQTWWHQVISKAGLELILNDSWSGSTIGYTGYNNIDCSQSSSFIYRFQRLAEQGFFEKNKIRTVFIFGGTNDSWADAPLGTMKYNDFKNEELYSVRPAICYFLKTVKEALPQAKIYCLINTELKPEISDCMINVCDKYGIEKIVFEEIDKKSGHPTIKGMQEIARAVLKALNQK